MKTPPPLPATAKSSVALTGAQETNLMTLRCRVQDAQLPKPLLGDPWAAYAAAQLAYDFSRVRAQPSMATVVALRARQLDRWAAAFLTRHAEATVVHLACGLDARAHRVEWGPGVRWFDVDLADVVELRQKVLPLPKGDYFLVAASVTDKTWLDAIPADRPTLVIMEGLTMYLSPEDGKALISRLCARFPSGELIFDTVGRVMIAMQATQGWLRNSGALMKWAPEDPTAIEEFHAGLKLKEDIFSTAMDGIQDAPFYPRLEFGFMSWFPWLRSIGRLLRYEF